MRVVFFAMFIPFISLISPAVFADRADKLADDLSKCMKVSSDKDRLQCFDKLADKTIVPIAPTKKIVSAKPIQGHIEPEQKHIEPEPEKTKAIEDFSKEVLKKPPEDKGPNSITATISKVKQLIRGQWVIHFENGQKWQQKDSAKIKLKVGDFVRLKKGTMGTVYLYKEGSKRKIRVKRLK